MNDVFLQIFNRLTIDLNPVLVYDYIPQDLKDNDYPYTQIGSIDTVNDDTDSETGFDASVQVTSYSRYRGLKEINQLSGFIYQSLNHWRILNTATHSIGDITQISQTTIVAPDGLTRISVQSFRLYFEPL